MTGELTDDQCPPLSPGQERLWFTDQAGTGEARRNAVVALRLRGQLRRPELIQAVRQLVARHHPLRTTVTTVDGNLRQRVWPAGPVEVKTVDLKPVPPAEREGRLAARVAEAVNARFDLASGPILRASLIQVSESHHVLVLCAHPIAADEWSTGILVTQLGELYAAALKNRSGPPPEPACYPDHAVRLRERYTEAEAATQLGYWRERLVDLPALPLPTDRLFTDKRGTAGAPHVFELPADVVSGLSALAAAHGGTLFDGLFTACQALLCRYSAQRDLALATLASGRTGTALAGLVGAFANTVVLRQTVQPAMPFASLLAANVDAIRSALAHQDVPFDRVAEETRVGRDVVPVMVTMRHPATVHIDLPWLDVEVLRPDTAPLAFDLTVGFAETGDGAVTGILEWDSALFDVDTVRRLARHLGVLLSAAVADPSLSVDELPLLDEVERRTLLRDWAVNDVDVPDRYVHELIGDRARSRPDSVAVVDGTATTTYAELDARANRVANLLVSRGVRPGDFVAVCLPRGAELIATLLAVLRAGGAYLTLDPGYPIDRLEHMLEDADAPMCVTVRRLVEKLPAIGARMICLDEQADALAAQPADPPPVVVCPRDAALVIFTSGSTGRPKGAVLEHRSLTRLFLGADYLTLTEDDVVGQAADPTFDAATFEIWGTLVAGARLVVLDKDTLLDPAALVAALIRHRLTALFVTTAVFNQVVAADPGAFRTLRAMLFGGEAVNPARVAQVLASAPPQQLLHLYGPTETTTFATWHEVREADGHTTVPIGRPVANTATYVLDERLEPVPVGVIGELFIGGPRVARGYLKRPELNAQRFLEDPFTGAPDERLYRTGDLVRWTSQGTLEYIGRADHQVKVRGFRIEPGEIELALQQHPSIKTALVVAQGDGEHKRLVAYVCPVDGVHVERVELREFVVARLPEFMVPAVFVWLAEFPLTSRGKIDRAALPEPEVEVDTANGVAPRTPIERTLATIWSEVLGVTRVGVTDNFYELGGDSVLGIKVVARARKAGLSIATKEVFRRQTIAELAAVAVAHDNLAA